jgi:hypothetical protein
MGGSEEKESKVPNEEIDMPQLQQEESRWKPKKRKTYPKGGRDPQNRAFTL